VILHVLASLRRNPQISDFKNSHKPQIIPRSSGVENLGLSVWHFGGYFLVCCCDVKQKYRARSDHTFPRVVMITTQH